MANTGIDDSDGTVGDLVSHILELLSLFKDIALELKVYIVDKFPKKTNFEWEKELFWYSDFGGFSETGEIVAEDIGNSNYSHYVVDNSNQWVPWYPKTKEVGDAKQTSKKKKGGDVK